MTQPDRKSASELLPLVEERRWSEIRERVQDWPAPELADLLMDCPAEDRADLVRALPEELVGEVFAHLDRGARQDLLEELTEEEQRALIREMDADDRTQLLEGLPEPVAHQLLSHLPPEEMREARTLLGFPEESVGRLMTPDYVAVQPDWTVEQALNHIRAGGEEFETVTTVYVVDRDGRLLDAVGLRRLLMSAPSTNIAELVRGPVVRLLATDDREEAVRVMERYDLPVLPVVDPDDVLLGIVTVDDVLDVVEEEATEDFHKMAPVGGGLMRTSLKQAGLSLIWRARIGWLLILVFMNIFSGAGIAYFEETLEAAIALAFFLPLLIDSGGNSGSQAATLTIRALAIGDVKVGDWFRMFAREVLVAFLLGITMAAGVALIALYRAPEILLVVTLTMTLVVMVGSLIGTLMPFLLTRLGMDPATASAPLITSVCDIAGVLIYFSIASWYLGL